MRLVVADTGPLNYLVLIDAIELLPKLFEKVFTTEAVRAELLNQDASVVCAPGRHSHRDGSTCGPFPRPLKIQHGAHSTSGNAKRSPSHARSAPTWSSSTIATASPLHDNWVSQQRVLWVYWTWAPGAD